MTQIGAIKEHLEHGYGITSKQAFEKFGCTRLSDKIFNLKKQGMNIESVRREGKDRYGHPVYYSEYRMVKKS